MCWECHFCGTECLSTLERQLEYQVLTDGWSWPFHGNDTKCFVLIRLMDGPITVLWLHCQQAAVCYHVEVWVGNASAGRGSGPQDPWVSGRGSPVGLVVSLVLVMLYCHGAIHGACCVSESSVGQRFMGGFCIWQGPLAQCEEAEASDNQQCVSRGLERVSSCPSLTCFIFNCGD